MTADLVRVRVQLPQGDAAQFAKFGPGWSDLWVRAGTSDEAVLDEVFLQDTYRVRGLDLTPSGEYLNDQRTVIDVGACTGIFSALCLAFGASHVIAVEPHPDNVALLRKNLCGHGGRVTIIEAAAAASEIVREWLGGAEGQAHSGAAGEDGAIAVEPVTLERLIDLATTPIALCKVDIESAEYDTILACDHEHLAQVERFAIETHGPEMCPWAEQKIGQLVEHLAYTHSVTVFGVPTRGGMAFAHRLDL